MFDPPRITGSIYQGGYITEKQGARLKEIGITHILNLDLPYHSTRVDMSGLGFQVIEILVNDMSPMTGELARKVDAAIQRAVDLEGGELYVHCNAGLSRSPTAVWLYLVAKGWDNSEATRVIAAAASNLHAPDPLLIGSLDLQGLKRWLQSPRWEIWVEIGGNRTLASIFETEGAARSELALLECHRSQHGLAVNFTLAHVGGKSA